MLFCALTHRDSRAAGEPGLLIIDGQTSSHLNWEFFVRRRISTHYACLRTPRTYRSLWTWASSAFHSEPIANTLVGKAAKGSLAECVLKDETIREIRVNSRGPSAKALGDR